MTTITTPTAPAAPAPVAVLYRPRPEAGQPAADTIDPGIHWHGTRTCDRLHQPRR